MSKGLEALNSLKSMACVEAGPQNKYITYAKEMEHNEMVKEKYNIIEKELDRLEKLEKVIEILKERGGIHLYINRNNDNKLTLDFDDCISCVLEPKEYNLLKEVLEDE